MTIFHGAPPKDNFGRVPNDWTRDAKLTLRGKGMLSYLQSHQDGYALTVEQMVAECREAKGAIYSAITELITAGYVQRVYRRDETGRVVSVDYYVIGADGRFPSSTPLPQNPEVENPEVVATCDDAEFAQVGATSAKPISGLSISGKSHPKKTNPKKTKSLEDHKEDSLPAPSAEQAPAAPPDAGRRDSDAPPTEPQTPDPVRRILSDRGHTGDIADHLIWYANTQMPGGPKGVGWWLTLDKKGHLASTVEKALNTPGPSEPAHPDAHEFDSDGNPNEPRCRRCSYPRANGRHRATPPAESWRPGQPFRNLPEGAHRASWIDNRRPTTNHREDR